MHKFLTAALILSLTLLCSIPQVFSEEEKQVLNMRGADIRSLIQWMADSTGKNFVVHNEVNGKVTLLSSTPLTKDQTWRVFITALQVNGFAAVESGDTVRVVPAKLALKGGTPVHRGSRSGTAVKLFELNNANADELAKLIKPLASDNAVITAYPDSNLLIVADQVNAIDHISRLVSRLDRASEDKVELVTLRHANAREAVASVKQLFKKNRGQDQQMAVDERSNSVLLFGDDASRARMKSLLTALDLPLEGQGNTQVIYLHYADAAEIAPILKNLADTIQKSQKQTGSISIESSKTANALVVNGPLPLLRTLRSVVEQLDIRRAQVLVEAMVVEVSSGVADDFGINWLSSNEEADGTGNISSVNALGRLTAGQLNSDGSGFQAGPGITLGIFNDSFQAAVRILESNQKANILSTPTIVAIDNEEASLLVGQNVPFITGQSTGSSSSTGDPFTTIERQDIGISLVVTPRINRGDSITLDIHQKTESIAPSVTSASDLVTNKREVITKALIKDGQVLVLGGLISEEETEIDDRVPILGSIPLIGRLFSSRGVNRDKTNLMVFIHPVILKDEEHMNEVSQQRYRFMQDQQEKAAGEDTIGRAEGPARMEDYSVFSPANRPEYR